MSKFKKIYLPLLFSVAINIGNIHASAAAATTTFTAADIITTELNENPVVTSGSRMIRYCHDPIAEGTYVFQGESVDALPAKTKFLYTSDVTTCQVVAIRDSISGRTVFTHADEFFDIEIFHEILKTFKACETVAGATSGYDMAQSEKSVSVSIVINQSDLETALGKKEFFGGYLCNVDDYLAKLSSVFEKSGVRPEIFRLSRSKDLSEVFKKYLIQDDSYRRLTKSDLNNVLQQLSENVTAGICFNVATGELLWWSFPLSRVYARSHTMIESYTKQKNKKYELLRRSIQQKAILAKQRQDQIVLDNMKIGLN
jgi:hypothetical protein